MSFGKFVLVMLVAVAAAKMTVFNMGEDFKPTSELEYVNYLKIILGRHDESTKLSSSLTEYARTHRPSLGNEAGHIMLCFIQTAPESDSRHQDQTGYELDIKGRLLSEMNETPHLFVATFLPPNQEDMVDDMVENYNKQGKLIHVIRGSETEIKRIQVMMQRNEERVARKLQQVKAKAAESPKGTYLIKFFFSLLFVFVIIASVRVISNDDGKKDTLLYAKFSADVNSR